MAVSLLPAVASAGDWPCYRGPNKDGITSDGIDRWPPEEIWRADVGQGYSQVTVSDGRVYTAGWSISTLQDTVYCFDENSTGNDPTPIWTQSYPCNWIWGGFEGTRATPTVDGNEVYMFSHEGRLSVFNKVNGTPLWNASTDWGRPEYGFASSPLIEGDLIIVNASNSGVAFSKTTHNIVWPGSSTGGAGYASPFAFWNGPQRTVVIFSNNISGVDPADGSILWYYNWDQGMADPIIHDDKVWFSCGWGKGCGVAPLGSGQLTADWTDTVMGNLVNCSVLYGNYVYGIGEGGRLKCIDFATGNEEWSQSGFGIESALMVADGELVVIDAGMPAADLVIVEATPSVYNEINRLSSIIDNCWTCSVVANGKLYIRSHEGTLVCYDVSAISDSITVTSPDGGENWTGLTTETVTWSSTGTVGNVKIELSIDGGSTWPTTLAANTANDGTENITVPDTPSAQCRIRVSETDGLLTDMSDADFTIALADTTSPGVSVTSVVIDGTASDAGVNPPIVTVAGSNLGQVATFSQEVALTGGTITVTAEDTANTTTINLDVTVP